MSEESLRSYTQEELLALTPEHYAKEGFAGKDAMPRAGMQTVYATAAATQLLKAELAPQELGFTLEALRQTLAMQEHGTAVERARAALDEALEVVRGMIHQPNNRGLTEWLKQCVAQLKRPEDLEAWLTHVLSVLRQYTVMVASLPPQ